MTNAEMRELDAFIAETVMGFEHPCLFEPTGATGEICTKCNHHGSFDRHFFSHYTSDAAAAMLVLEKCLDKCGSDVVFFKSTDKPGMFRVFKVKDAIAFTGLPTKFVEAETLPAAICLFAKQLFSK